MNAAPAQPQAAPAATLVTGASRGLGRELALALARRGRDVVLTARDAGALARVADEIAALGRPRPAIHACDLSADGVAELERALAGRPIAGLVNNAGFGLAGAAARLDRTAQLDMIDLNIRALTDLTLRLLPRLIESRGNILNVASVAAFTPGPGMAVYYASKAFVLSFSEALGQELKGAGVGVTALCPGPLATGFWRRAGASEALMRRVAPSDLRPVADAGVEAMLAGRRRVTPGLLNRAFVALAPLLPRALSLPVVAHVQATRLPADENGAGLAPPGP